MSQKVQKTNRDGYIRQSKMINTCSKDLDEAREIFIGSLKWNTREREIINIDRALNRSLAKAVIAPEDSPNFSMSLIDGYALISKDTLMASKENPISLKIVGSLKIGAEPLKVIAQGLAMYIPTGGMVPKGADAVAKIKDCQEKTGAGYVDIISSISNNENIFFKGDKFKKGVEVISAFTRLRPSHIGLLAEFNMLEIEVCKKPKVAIFSSGDEIVDTTSDLKHGQIRDSNTYIMSAMVEEAGGIPLKRGIIKDDFETMKKMITYSIEKEDMVIVTGGTAVDRKNFTAMVFDSIGSPGVLINGVAMKGGRPVVLANIGGKPIIGLPGHPSGAIYCFDLFVKPAIDKALGIVWGNGG